MLNDFSEKDKHDFCHVYLKKMLCKFVIIIHRAKKKKSPDDERIIRKAELRLIDLQKQSRVLYKKHPSLVDYTPYSNGDIRDGLKKYGMTKKEIDEFTSELTGTDTAMEDMINLL